MLWHVSIKDSSFPVNQSLNRRINSNVSWIACSTPFFYAEVFRAYKKIKHVRTILFWKFQKLRNRHVWKICVPLVWERLDFETLSVKLCNVGNRVFLNVRNLKGWKFEFWEFRKSELWKVITYWETSRVRTIIFWELNIYEFWNLKLINSLINLF